MSLHPHQPEAVPEETARVTQAAFPEGNRSVRIREALDTIYDDDMFAPLFPTRGQHAESPWRLALVTLFQFAEGLSDRQAADAVRSRIDWTYALSLELALVRALNRVELVAETLRHALNDLAVVAPDWLRAHAQPEWVERYDRRAVDDRLPTKKEQRQALAQRTGAVGAAASADQRRVCAPARHGPRPLLWATQLGGV